MNTRNSATVHGWLLLLPAMALLALFTHWPAVATSDRQLLLDAARPRAAVALRRPRQLPRRSLDDPVFWQALVNNLWFALGTIPVSIALALLMALWVNDRIAGRALVRMAYFTPTVLPMIAVANIWLFFYTPQYGLLEQITGLFGAASAQLARQPRARRLPRDRRRDLEGGRLLHDLLPRGAAADPAVASARPRRSRAPRAGTSFAACSSRC